ncbi:conserved membrane hypothetical protein [Frankia canadensis]|uniref:DUF5134 domain-containing protein n=1 Tax=Frankia canadensis TaxID=1836972 RepID=A0A2I2KJW6_9ACTN|nr:DUF5134 domain-containing protein [Frankia canadensis]SNQ45958.1 conserved membrane hypothetical protein [Frankia canadensis]SOU53248.1 conserved membrane hypothetical protein [Frankia canadensis]
MCRAPASARAAVRHDHLASPTTHLPAAVTVTAAMAAALVAAFHLVRIGGGVRRARRPEASPRRASDRGSTFPRRAMFPARAAFAPSARFVPVEAGHALTAAGMAVMFAGPAGWATSDGFAVGYLLLAGIFLTLILTSSSCCEPARWSCCSMLVVESLAMACMARAGRWPVGDLGDLGDLAGWFAVIFAASAVLAVAGPLLRRSVSAWGGAPAPLTPAASRLVMATGMLLMLL